MTKSATSTRVFEPPEVTKSRENTLAKERPSHWANAEGTRFRNPWSSWREHDAKDHFYIVFQHASQYPPIPANINELIPVHKPTWGADGQPTKLKGTWLGHASCLAEFPARSEGNSPTPARGVRVLFDPVFSERCSPVKWAGPKRITPSPCQVDDLPEVDAVVISHDHYDHLDTETLRALAHRQPTLHFFVPRRSESLLHSFGISSSHLHTLDWWESRRLEVSIPLSSSPDDSSHTTLSLDLTCTPCQHNSGRGFMDRFYDLKTLWSSWVVEEVLPPGSEQGKKVFFAGDTGYRAVLDGQEEDEAPVCPAFKEIGERFGGIDLAFIPIGAYLPRRFMSPIHCAPQDSVRIFKDVRAKRGVGIHWGTFILTLEEVDEPPKRLREECEKLGIEEGVFSVCGIGETSFF